MENYQNLYCDPSLEPSIQDGSNYGLSTQVVLFSIKLLSCQDRSNEGSQHRVLSRN